MAKQTYYAQREIQTEAPDKAGPQAGDVVGTIETDLPIERFLAGLQTGLISTQKPKADKPEAKKADADAAKK